MDNNFVVGLFYDISSLNIDAWKKTEVLNIIDNVVCTVLGCEGDKEQLREEWKGVYKRLNG